MQQQELTVPALCRHTSAATHPTKRWAEPQDIAAAFMFLLHPGQLSCPGTDMITGQVRCCCMPLAQLMQAGRPAHTGAAPALTSWQVLSVDGGMTAITQQIQQ